MTVKPIPEGYHSVTPYLIIRGATEALDFYKSAFGACEVMRLPAPGGKIGHAEIQIGDSIIMLADEEPEMGNRSPKSTGGSPVTLMVYVEDVDTVAAQAVQAGLRVLEAIKDEFYGDRSGKFEDPFGHVWILATHKEDVPPDELQRRIASLYGAPGA